MTRVDVDRAGELRRVWFALVVLAAAVAAMQVWRYSAYVVDDIFITLRYARHFNEGLGLVFNPGERVEGYTNFAHVLLAAGCLRLGLPPIVALKVLAVVAFLWLLVGVYRLERRVVGEGLPLAILFVLPLGAFAYWAVSPMEAMLFAAIQLAALRALVEEGDTGRRRASALLFVLLSFVRPEGVGVFATATAAFALAELVHRGAPGPLRRHGLNLMLFVVPVVAYEIWRISYFGSPLPNTFYARVVGGAAQWDAGVLALGEWARAQPLFAVALLFPLPAAAAAIRRQWTLPWVLAALYLVALAEVAYAVAIGGDFMPFHRFFVPVVPLLAIIASATLRAATAGVRQRSAIVASVVAVHALWALAAEEPYRALVADRTAVVGERVGKWMTQQLPPGSLIAVNTAGAIPYFSNLPAIDMLGLTEPAIARRPVFVTTPGWTGHRRGWGDHVLSRRPRIVLWYNSAGAREPHYLGDRELADSALFRFFYRRQRARLEAPDRNAMVARFAGRSTVEAGAVRLPDLSLRAYAVAQPIPHTLFADDMTEVAYFELDNRDVGLWNEAREGAADAAALVDLAVRRWSPAVSDEAPPSDEVRELCDQARVLIEAERFDEARRILSQATRLNRSPRSPLVYQYVANLAALTGELFTAIAAQKEALRLAPRNSLYRENLRHLLAEPYEQAARPRRSDPDSGS